jgi:FkbM family methyltransferase
MIVVQIGVNRGNDDLTEIIKDKNIKKLILVEPLNIHNDHIQQCYSWVKKLYIENIAIGLTPQDDDMISFYYHISDGPEFQVASIDKNHVAKHYGWDYSGIVEIKVKSMSLNNLFKKYKLSKIDVLFIDAEGIDDLIIKSIDFSNYDIKKIYFENLHITHKDIYEFLKEKNYKITQSVGTNGWCSLAER